MQLQTSSSSIVRKQVKPRLAKKLLLGLFGKLQHGCLTVVDGDDTYRFGDSTLPLHAEIMVHDQSFYNQALFHGTVGAGESYMEGHWDTPALAQLVQLLVRNMAMLDRIDHLISAPTQWGLRLNNFFKRNSKKGSKENILAHYDVGNEFYKLFLDESMTYSCGIFAESDNDLYSAQLRKFETICQRLDLQTGEHLLEIGTGWGSFAIYAAQKYGVKVTTTTISERQHDYAEARIKEAGLEDQITLLKQDYRDLEGQYDKLVSVEMIEAVGHRYLSTYFKKCESLLHPGGRLLIQSITIADQRYDRYRKQVDFIQRFVFPGGFLPSINAISTCMKNKTSLQISDVYDIGPHYAKTLRHWSEGLRASKNEVERQGRSTSFYRLWQFYFQYCEGGFLEGGISTAHILANRPKYG